MTDPRIETIRDVLPVWATETVAALDSLAADLEAYEECIAAVESGEITLPQMYAAMKAHRSEEISRRRSRSPVRREGEVMNLSPEHQRLIETVRSAVLDVGHEGADLAVHHPTALAALDALALKLARLEKLEAAARHYLDGTDPDGYVNLRALLAAREEEAT